MLGPESQTGQLENAARPEPHTPDDSPAEALAAFRLRAAAAYSTKRPDGSTRYKRNAVSLTVCSFDTKPQCSGRRRVDALPSVSVGAREKRTPCSRS
jgi:hypothetical protein